jgi:hypothetical protein
MTDFRCFALTRGGPAEADSFRLDRHSKTHLVWIVLALLAAAFIFAGSTQSLETGRLGSVAEADSIAGYNGVGTYPHARVDEARPEDERSEFENVASSACGAGDVFGCGLLLTWRALLTLLRFPEQIVIFVLIALAFRWFVWARVREAIEKRSRRAQRPM